MILVLGELLLAGAAFLDPDASSSSIGLHAGGWLINLSVLVYVISVLWVCGQKLSTWGYVWRGVAVALACFLIDTSLSGLFVLELGPLEFVLLLAVAPWIGAWVSRRFEVAES